jgi:hypothetical protein
MIDISSLNPVIQTTLLDKPFLYKASNGRIVDVDKLSAIVKSNDVTEVVDVLKNHDFNNGVYPFYFQHTDLFTNAQELFKSMFGLDPDIVIYSYKNDSTISAFLFSNKSLIEKSISKSQIEINFNNIEKNIKKYDKQIKEEENKGLKVSTVKIDNDVLKVILPQGVFPVIGVLNSIDSTYRVPNFNLIFGSEYLQNLDFPRNYPIDTFSFRNADTKIQDKWTSNIDEFLIDKFSHGVSLYSIDKFDFKLDEEDKYDFNPVDMTSYFDSLLTKAKSNFIDTIVSFQLAVNRGGYLPLSRDQFSSFIPHFYGFDRLFESVSISDDFAKTKLKHLYDTSLSFANTIPNTLTCKSFIDYFLRDSIINFANFRSDPGKEILKAFQAQPQIPLIISQKKEILSSFITAGQPNRKYDSFLNGIDGQVAAKNKVYPIL